MTRPRAETSDIAGQDYWERGYKAGPAAVHAFDPRQRGLRGHWKRQVHAYFLRTLAGRDTHALSLMEVGCGGSEMLPYFAREFGFRVAGLDYAAGGCALAKESLQRAGVAGQILCADLFSPPDSAIEEYDVVVSFGVVEHFTDTRACVAAMSRLLRPGGLMVTFIPNMAGLTGLLQKVLDQSVYDRHVPLDGGRLCAAHSEAGLAVRDCRYLLALNLGVVNINDVQRNTFEWLAKSAALRGLQAVTAMVWMIETVVGPIAANRLTSPYVICVAEKPA